MQEVPNSYELRDDFAHDAREAGWILEEVAFQLGLVTMEATPTIQAAVRQTRVSRAQVKDELKLLKEGCLPNAGQRSEETLQD